MRVSYLSVSDQLGGSEVMLLQTLMEVRRAQPGWRLSVVLPGPGPLAAAAGAAGAEVRVVPMPPPLQRLGEWAAGGRTSRAVWRLARAAASVPAYQRRMADTVADLQPDVIHSNGFKSHVVSARLRRGPAVVWHMHEYVGPRPMTRRLLARYAPRATVIVANSRSVASDVSAVTGSPVLTIYNGVDVGRFSPDGPVADLDAAAGLARAPAGTVRVGLVATFSRWKGHEVFLRAIAALPGDAGVRGYVVGGPVYETAGSQHSLDELRRLAATLGVQERVGFTGFLPQPADVMRALDVVVHASTDPEPFGLVVAEAMACGRPVLTSGTGGTAELIEEEQTAVRHAAGDHAGLSRGMLRLAADPALRARFGACGRARAARLFDARRLGEEFTQVYRQAAGGKAAR